jgi:hypothetical protein
MWLLQEMRLAAGGVVVAGPLPGRTSPALTSSFSYVTDKIMALIGARLIMSMFTMVALCACAQVSPSVAPAVLPPDAFGVYEDNDIGALNQSSWAFAAPMRTHDNPIDAARAVIAVEYLADELHNNPRWVGMDVTSALGMVQARKDTRRVLGIVENAPPRFVVDTLLRLTAALNAGDQAEAIRILGSPVFTLPPTVTLHVLSNLPYIRSANIATLQAANTALLH